MREDSFGEPDWTVIEVETPRALEKEHRENTGLYEDDESSRWVMTSGSLTEALAPYGQETSSLDDEDVPRGMYFRRDGTYGGTETEKILEIRYTGDIDELEDFYETVIEVRENDLD